MKTEYSLTLRSYGEENVIGLFSVEHKFKEFDWPKRPCDRFWPMKYLKFVLEQKINQ